jgi:hypothetical protein
MADGASLHSSSLANHLIDDKADPAAIIATWKEYHATNIWLRIPIETDRMPRWAMTNQLGQDFLEQLQKDFVEGLYADIAATSG